MSSKLATPPASSLPASPVRAGKLFILSGPSGSGKSTVIRQALADPGIPLRLAVSVTTRPPRSGEVDGFDYYFWTKERFDQAVAAGQFLEWADVYGNRYGTLRQEVDPFLAQGQSVLLEIDVQGGLQIRRSHPDCVLIFIRTSDASDYETRLRRRQTDTEAALEKRLEAAQRELEIGAGQYDHRLLNDNLDAAVRELRRLFRTHMGGNDAG